VLPPELFDDPKYDCTATKARDSWKSLMIFGVDGTHKIMLAQVTSLRDVRPMIDKE
jgi:hypothetical protein